MRYLSLFSGIGGFEVAIHTVLGKDAECCGYSEIDTHAISEYEQHYPSHTNLGDVKSIKKRTIDKMGKIDLIVGGFPCSDLSSMNHKGRQGLDGHKSGLFWTMLMIIGWARKNNPSVQIIIENNASMSHKWRDLITHELSKVFKKNIHCNYFDSSQWVPQRRRRYYWTTNKIPAYVNNVNNVNNENKKSMTTVSDILEDVTQKEHFNLLSDTTINYINSAPSHLQGTHGHIMQKIKKTIKNNDYRLYDVDYQTRLDTTGSSSLDLFARCIDTRYENSFVLDYRLSRGRLNFVPRFFTKLEISRLFGFPENYVVSNSKTVYIRLYGMTVVPPVVMHIIHNLGPTS